MNITNVILSSDEKYAQHLGVTICSLMENNRNQYFDIYIIDGGMSENTKSNLSLLKGRYGFGLVYLQPDPSLFKNAYLSDYLTEAAYYRILLGDLLPPNITNVLYLDSDMIIMSDISELFTTQFDENIICAISDPGIVNFRHLSISEKKNYFNSGFLYVDLKKWRDEDIGHKCIDFINTNREKIILHDQDVLNYVLNGRWKHITPSFNVMTHFYDGLGDDVFTPKEISRAIQDPLILHFNTAVKPWHRLCNHPRKRDYKRYLAMTPWYNYKAPMPTLAEFIKFYYYSLFSQDTRIKIRKRILEPLGFKKRCTKDYELK
ncbi:MAG: glycosyltransferase family 8 protein [Patescibacteria group bacterium]|nr:glycosyltransferase family 8 protein [Patescibacteria group bacterium]